MAPLRHASARGVLTMPTFTIWLLLSMNGAGTIALHSQFWSAASCEQDRAAHIKRNKHYGNDEGHMVCYRLELPQPPVGKKG